MLGRRHRELKTLETALLDERRDQRDAFLREKLDQVSASHEQRRPGRSRAGLALAFALVTALAFSLAGGLAYAKPAVTGSISSIASAVSAVNGGGSSNGHNSGGTAVGRASTPASTQYTAKVLVCHVPPTPNAAPVTLSVVQSALQAHLGHGDRQGRC